MNTLSEFKRALCLLLAASSIALAGCSADGGNASSNDRDGDGVVNAEDNCPSVPNPNQADLDGDGLGNVCDNDLDGDGTPNDDDNCPNTPNPSQEDSDGDGIGDACDTDADTDGDGVSDGDDNCPTVPNPDQEDSDSDGIGDACETDTDGDGVPDDTDNCPTVANADQADQDGDGIGDVCDDDVDGDGLLNDVDNCPETANADQTDTDGDGVGDACDFDNDMDGDGVDDGVDNCPNTPNPDQADQDGDGIGDVCDDDVDGDGVLNDDDNCPETANAEQTDTDADGVGDACDSLSELSCNPTAPFKPILQTANNATSVGSSDLLCLACSVSDPDNVIDDADDGTQTGGFVTAAQLSSTVALLNNGVSVRVDDGVNSLENSSPYAGGLRIAYIISDPGDNLSLNLLEASSITTYLGDDEQEVIPVDATSAAIDLLALQGNPDLQALIVSTGEDFEFDAMEFNFRALLEALTTIDVYAVCVGPPDAVTSP